MTRGSVVAAVVLSLPAARAAAQGEPASASLSLGVLSVSQSLDGVAGLAAEDRTFSTAAVDAAAGSDLGAVTARASLDAKGGAAGVRGDRYGEASAGLDGVWSGALSRVALGLRGARLLDEADGRSLSLGEQIGLAFVVPEERKTTTRGTVSLVYERAWSARFGTRVSGQHGVTEREALSRYQSYEVALDRQMDALWRLSLAYAGQTHRYGDDEPSTYAGPDVVSRHEVGPVTELELRAGVRASREEPGERTESGRVAFRHAPAERAVEVAAQRAVTQRPAGAGAELDDGVRASWSERVTRDTALRFAAAEDLAQPLGAEREGEEDRRARRVEAGLVVGFGPAVVARPSRQRLEVSLSVSQEEASAYGGTARREVVQTAVAATF